MSSEALIILSAHITCVVAPEHVEHAIDRRGEAEELTHVRGFAPREQLRPSPSSHAEAVEIVQTRACCDRRVSMRVA